MSRTLKRVPMSFDWPLRELWGGYVNPYYKLAGKCPDCEHGYDREGGRRDANAALFYNQWYGNAPFDPAAYGATPLSIDHPAIRAFAERNVKQAPDYMTAVERKARDEFRHGVMLGFPHDQPLVPFPTFDREPAIRYEIQRLHSLWVGQWKHQLIQADVDALLEHDRLWDFTRVPINEEQEKIVADKLAAGGNSWLPFHNGCRPTADDVNTWSISGGLGHGGLNSGICVEERCKRESVPYTCTRCTGSGRLWPTPEIEKQYEDWTKTDPPTGDGYQLWSTTSEGCPVSPVFGALEELCAWAADHATTFASHKASAAEWKQMLEDDFVHATDGQGNIFR